MSSNHINISSFVDTSCLYLNTNTNTNIKIDVNSQRKDKKHKSINFDVESKHVISKEIIGNFHGYGSYGKVVSNPRIPLQMESIEDLVNIKEVSKIYQRQTDYEHDKNFFDTNFIFLNNNMSEYVVLPISYGQINKDRFNSYQITYLNDKYKYNLTSEFKKNKDFYQITFSQGENIIKITKESTEFLFGLLNIVNCLTVLNDYKLFFPDLKIQNIVSIDSVYKLIDYTSLLEINDSEIDNSLNSLLYSTNNYFECGFDYYSYPSFPILMLKGLNDDIFLDIYLDDNDDNDDNFNKLECYSKDTLIFGQEINEKQDFYDSIHIYLLEVVEQRDFAGFDYINRILKLSREKMINFSFSIQLFDTKTLEYIDFIVDNYNIFDIMNQIYYEKLGYLDPNFKRLRSILTDKNTLPSDKNSIRKSINRRIFEYSLYFNNYIKYYFKQCKNNDMIKNKQLLINKIQNYSFGIIIFNFISTFYSNKSTYDNEFIKLLKLALTSTIIQVYDPKTKSWLINLNDFTNIESVYRDLIKDSDRLK